MAADLSIVRTPTCIAHAPQDEPVAILRSLFDANPIMRGIPRAIAYMITLPHRAQRSHEVWIKDFGSFSLIIEPGRLFLHSDKVGQAFGVPFGPRARMLFAYLITWSADSDSFEIDRGGISLNRWAERFGLSIGGKTYAAFQDQELRLFSNHFLTTFGGNGYEGATWDQFCINGMRPDPVPRGARPDPSKRNMVRLSAELYSEIKNHPTRIPVTALSQLSNQSLGLDIYFWLAYRLPVMRATERVSWDDLDACFGTSYRNRHHFHPRFLEKLKLVLSIYGEARVDVEAEGLVLHPSRAPSTP
ncbi:MAG: pirin [Verrucomicrobiaceae bacterium]|nr:pirin [Verrucomicrobiaceae bacterium]